MRQIADLKEGRGTVRQAVAAALAPPADSDALAHLEDTPHRPPTAGVRSPARAATPGVLPAPTAGEPVEALVARARSALPVSRGGQRPDPPPRPDDAVDEDHGLPQVRPISSRPLI